jgi:hypothetical protein
MELGDDNNNVWPTLQAHNSVNSELDGSGSSDNWVEINGIDSLEGDDASSWYAPSTIRSVVSLDHSISSSWDQRSMPWSYKDALLYPATDVISSNVLHYCEDMRNDKKLCFKKETQRTRIVQSINDDNDDNDDVWGKPLVKKLRKKYETGGRRKNLKGHTGRSCPYAAIHGCDIELEGGHLKYLTAVESTMGGVVGRYQLRSLNKNRAWEEVPAILEAESAVEPKLSKVVGNWAYRPITTFQLRPQVVLREQLNAKREAHYRNRLIYFMPSSTRSGPPRKVFAKIDTNPPDGIKGKPLIWKARTSLATNYSFHPSLHGAQCWDVQKDGRSLGSCFERPFLEIDLGRSTKVSAISTQGADPPVRVYPHVIWSGKSGFYRVEGRPQKGRYEGPFWRVLDPSWRALDPRLRWVRSYELWWRPDGRRGSYRKLGVFKGNDDTTTERAHVLKIKESQTGDLCCRYLRFVPIDLENGGAMRIGIYGERMEQTNAISTQTAAVDKGPSDDWDLDTLVEYRLLHPSPVKVLGAMQRDIFCHSGHNKSNKSGSHFRCKRTQQAEEEAREHGI